MENISFQGTAEDLSKKKTSYFSKFALKHMPVMRILKSGGLLGEGGWKNVAEHCLVVATTADVLAEGLGADTKKTVEATLIHDWFKRREREAMNKSGGAKGYEEASKEDIKELKELGISEEIISLAHANIPESADEEYLKSRSLEEKIAHLSDLIVSGDKIVEFNERLDSLLVGPKASQNIEFSDGFKEQYGGKSLYDVQREVGNSEQKEFEEVLGIKEGTLIQYIKETLEKKIEEA